MKTLSYMEVQKLVRFLDAQKAVVHSIEEVAADFLGFHPESLPEAKGTLPVLIVIGSQRGFCGDFNHALINHLTSAAPGFPQDGLTIIVIGRRLHTLLEGDRRVAAYVEGPGIAEEVTLVLSQVVEELAALQDRAQMLNVYALYHGGEDSVEMQRLLPPFQQFRGLTPRFSQPPILNQSPQEFLVELSDQYLFAALHEMLYTSLMAENRRRLTHLEGAVKRLEDKSEDLARRCNTLRQEESIEEIEVLLLNAGGPDRTKPHIA